MIVKLLTEPFGVSKLKKRLQRLLRVYTTQIAKLLEISCRDSNIVKTKTPYVFILFISFDTRCFFFAFFCFSVNL